MSAYNVLISKINCHHCGKSYNGKLQFKFGDTWQYTYKVGESIKWGGNDIGKPLLGKVKVYGILEESSCPYCKKDVLINDFDVIIYDDKIIEVRPLEDILDYENSEEHSYKVISPRLS